MFNSCFVCIHLLSNISWSIALGNRKVLLYSPDVSQMFSVLLSLSSLTIFFYQNSPYTCHNRLDLSFVFINFGCFILQVLTIDQLLLLAGILSEIHHLDLVKKLTALKWIIQPIHMNFDILANSFSVLII